MKDQNRAGMNLKSGSEIRNLGHFRKSNVALVNRRFPLVASSRANAA
jgi:hypothetical protein